MEGYEGGLNWHLWLDRLVVGLKLTCLLDCVIWKLGETILGNKSFIALLAI